jgi:hypothetical protein
VIREDFLGKEGRMDRGGNKDRVIRVGDCLEVMGIIKVDRRG